MGKRKSNKDTKKHMHATAEPISETLRPETGRVSRKDSKGRVKREQRYYPMHPDEVDAIPPWDRDEFRYHEVPAVLKRLFNFAVRSETVYRWMTKGRPNKNNETEIVMLASNKKLGRIFVKKADLLRFMELT